MCLSLSVAKEGALRPVVKGHCLQGHGVTGHTEWVRQRVNERHIHFDMVGEFKVTLLKAVTHSYLSFTFHFISHFYFISFHFSVYLFILGV